MKRLMVVFILFIVCGMSSFAEDNEKKVQWDLYGFVRSELFMDTYRGIGAAEEQYYLMPKYIGVDNDGKDLNEEFTSTFSPLHTRFGFKINGPEVLGAKTDAKVETDFFGYTSAPFLLRLRLAYFQFHWEKSTVLAGQDWHPFFTKQCFPQTTNLNTGTPFNAFSRTPLIRYDYNAGNFKLTGAAIFELQFGSFGPDGKTSDYSRNAAIPEMLAGVEYYKNGIRLGAMAEYKALKPRLYTADKAYVTDQLVSGFNYAAYFQYKKEKLNVLAKGFYGGLMSHLVMMGGYGVSDFDPATGKESYTSFNAYSAMLNVQYGGALKVGGFVGYGKSLGTKDALYDFGTNQEKYIWGRFLDIQDMYRGSVSLWYTIKNVSFRTGFEVTTANYSEDVKTDRNLENGLFNTIHPTTNNRLSLAVLYFF